MFLQPLEFPELNLKCTKRNKKDKPNISSVKKTKLQNDTIHIAVCLFLFLLVSFEFGFENYMDCEDLSREHLQICFNIICHLQFEIFQMVSW
jgi:hypothetical protein